MSDEKFKALCEAVVGALIFFGLPALFILSMAGAFR